MSNIFLDVGPPKTATTWRQRILLPAMDVRDFSHVFLDGTAHYVNLDSDAPIVLSDEGLYGRFHRPDSVYRDRERAFVNMRRFFPDASVIICRRDVYEWQRSLWKQYVWAGGSDGFEGWLSRIDSGVFDIDGYIARLQDAFGNVLVLDFEMLKRDYLEFSRQICDFVGVPVPNFDNRRLNVSLSERQTEILRQLNKLWWTHERQGIPGFRLWRELLYMLTEKNKTDGGQQ